jgi:hypothetical protein
LSCVLRLLLTVTVSQILLILITLPVLRNRVRYCAECPSTKVSLTFSHNCTGIMCLEKEEYRGKFSFSSHQIKGTCYQLLTLSLSTWLRLFVRFSTVDSFFSLFLLCILWKEASVHGSHLERTCTVPPWENKIYVKLFGIFQHRRFMCSFICVSIDSRILISYLPNTILLILCSICSSLITGNSFILMLCPLTGSHPQVFIRHFLTFWHYMSLQTHLYILYLGSRISHFSKEP